METDQEEMIRFEVDGKTNYVNSTPILVFVESERNITLAKFIIDGKEYNLRVNNLGKAQMT